MINSIPLKFLAVNLHYNDDNYPNDYQDTIIERLGFKASYYIASDRIYAGLDANEGGGLRCYSDNNFNTYKPYYTHPCDYIAVGIEEIKKEMSIDIYPNPANNVIHIETKESKLTYIIYSIDSRLIKEGKIEAKQINCEELSNGVYILTIKEENNILRHFKIFKNWAKTPNINTHS